MRMRIFLAIAVVLFALGAGRTPAQAFSKNCDQCEDLPGLFKELENALAALNHFKKLQSAGNRTGKYPKNVQTGAEERIAQSSGGSVVPYFGSITTDDCPVYRTKVDAKGREVRVNGQLQGDKITLDDIKYGEKYCKPLQDEIWKHEKSHHDDCSKIWWNDHHSFVDGPKLGLPKNATEAQTDAAWTKAIIESEIKAYEISVNHLNALIEDLLTRCLSDASRCKAKCQKDDACYAKCMRDSAIAHGVIIQMNELKRKNKNFIHALENSTR